jgi:phage-related minor tail protein
MTDFASIGIELDSRPVVEGTRALDALAETSARVEQKVEQMNGSMNDTVKIMRASGEATKTADDASAKFLANLQREVSLFGANRAEIERYNAAAAGMSTATQRAAAALGAKIDAMQRDEKAARDAAAAEDQAAKAADRFLKSLQDQVATLGMSTTQLQAYRAAQLGISDAAAPLIKKLEETGSGARGASGHMDGFSLSSMGARRELIVLAHEMSQGNFQKFGGSMMVLGEQTGAASLLFSAAGVTILAVGAAVIGTAAAMIKGAHEQKAMNDALIMTGNYAGTTSDNLNALAHSAVEAGGGIGEAKKAVTELAGSGKFTSEQIGLISEAAVAMEHAAGKSIGATIKEFESLAIQTSGNSMRSTEAISRAALKLDDTYHFLTESVYEQIRALEKEGDQKGASALATETLARVTKDRAEEMAHNLGYVSRGWNAVKEAIGGAVDAIGSWGAKATPGSEVDKYVAQLKSFDAATAFRNQEQGRDPSALTAVQESERLAIVKDLTAAVIVKNKADADAIAQGKAVLAQSEAEHAASRVMQDDARLEKKGLTELQVAIREYGQDLAKIAAANPDSPLLSQDAVNAHMAALTKAHTPAPEKGQDDRSQRLQDALTLAKTQLDGEKAIYDEREKMLSTYHSKFALSDDDYYAGRAVARAEYIAAEAATFAKESALMDAAAKAAKNPQEVAAAKAKYDSLVEEHKKFLAAMANTQTDDQVGQLATAKAITDASSAATDRYTTELQKQLKVIEDTAGARQRSKSAIEGETAALYAQAVANMKEQVAAPITEQHTQADHDAAVAMLADLEKELGLHQKIAAALQAQEAAEFHKKAADQAIQDWQRAGASIADSLSNAFGTGGKAIGEMFKAYAEGMSGQLRAQKDLAAAKKLSDDNPEKLEAINRAQLQGAQAQLKSYGDMAQAAEGFFQQGSSGYKAMAAASEVLRAAEVGLSLVKGVNAVLTQGEGDPYSAFARMAAMAAIVTGLGVALTGGGGSAPSAAQRQAAQGTGTILGDGNAKSDSISKSIELTAANSSTQINYLSGMLTSLQAIQTNIGSFASQIVQNTNISNPQVGNLAHGYGTTNLGAADMTMTGAEVGSYFGPIGTAVGAVVGYIASKIPVFQNIFTSIMGGKQSVSDSGFTMDATSLGSVLSNGVSAKSYADITTSGGWFGKDKTSVQTTPLGDEANRQFGAVIKSLADSITQASTLLGACGDDFTAKLNSFVVDIGNVSLKGLSGDDQQKALEAVFSKLGDQMAQWVVGGLEPFEKVGEGYLQTLVRVASDYAKLDASLQSIGKTFGAVGIESVGAREGLISLMGGIDNLQSKTADFAQNFLTKGQQLAPVAAYVSQQLGAMNLGWVQTREQFASVVACLDLTTTSGQQTYASLMNLESAFAATHAAIVDTTKSEQEIADERKSLQDKLDALTMSSAQLHDKERATIDASNLALYDRVSALQAEKDAVQAAKDAMQAAKDVASGLMGDVDNAFTVLQNTMKPTTDALTARINAEKALSDAIKSTLSGMKAASTDLTDRMAAQAQIKAALAVAKAGGPLPTADSLKDALSVVSQDASTKFATQADYLKDLYTTKNDLSQLGDLADSSLSVDQKQLDSLNAMLDAAKKQVDLLKGIDTTGLSIAQALAGFQTAITAAKANPVVAATSAISDQYHQSLGRAPDAAGLAYWQQQAASGVPLGTITQSIAMSPEATIQGMYQSLLGRPADAAGLQFFLNSGASMADIASSLKDSGEYKKLHPFAIGTNFVPETMPALVHEGERIIPAADNRALMARLSSPSSNNDALAAEIKALRETVAKQQTALDKIAKNTGDHKDMFETATAGGGPLLVEIAQ